MSTNPSPRSGERIQQLSVFIAGRTIGLASLERALEPDNVRICAISLLSAGDHAVVRLVVDRPAVAQLALERAGYTVHRSELLGVALSRPDEPEVGIRRVLSALLSAEVRIEYVYALIRPVAGQQVLALNVDDLDVAARALHGVGLTLIDQERLGWGDLEAP